MLDMFGRRLHVGQHVFYADEGDDGNPILCVYRILEVAPDVITAELLNDATGNWFYLPDTEKRCGVIGNANELYTTAMYYSESTIH